MNLTKLFFEDIIKASDISTRNKDIMFKRLNGETFTDIGKEYGISRERIRQCEQKTINDMKAPYRLGLSYRGYYVKMFKEKTRNGLYRTIPMDEMNKASIEVLPIPKQVINALAHGGILTVGEARRRMALLWKPKNMGPKSVKLVKEALKQYYGKEIL